jgi:alcohol dehydrogenase
MATKVAAEPEIAGRMWDTLFGFEMPTRLLFGVGAVGNLSFECSLQGWQHALIVTDRGVRNAGLTQPVEGQLQEAGVRYEIYDGVLPNPTIECIEAALPMAQATDVVIAVGGGSVIDSAKLINVLRTYGGRVLDYEGTDTIPGACKPLVAIPTTAGTGSEVTFIAMFTHPERHQKMPVLSRYLAPHLAIVDPELSRRLPPCHHRPGPAWTRSPHAIEAIVDLQANPLSDVLAFEAIRLILRYLPRAVKEAHTTSRHAPRWRSPPCLRAPPSTTVWWGWHTRWHMPSVGLYDLPHGLCCALALAPCDGVQSAQPTRTIRADCPRDGGGDA